MKTEIYIVRHGESVTNKMGIFTGIIDVPLSDLGKKQAEKICKFLEDKNIFAIYSSPLSRAFDTVSPLAEKLGKQIIKDERFIEVYFGRWEGKEREYLVENEPEFRSWHIHPALSFPPDGEDPKDAAKRFLKGMKERAEENAGKSIVIAAHGAVIAAVSCGIGYYDFETAAAKDIARNASVTKLIYEDGKFSVEFYGYEEHLGDLKAAFKYA